MTTLGLKIEDAKEIIDSIDDIESKIKFYYFLEKIANDMLEKEMLMPDTAFEWLAMDYQYMDQISLHISSELESDDSRKVFWQVRALSNYNEKMREAIKKIVKAEMKEKRKRKRKNK